MEAGAMVSSSPLDAPVACLPVTVINGSLGAGKTSVLKHVLRHSDKRLAVVVNEVAEYSIDLKGMKDRRAGYPDFLGYEVCGGCICCTRREAMLDKLRLVSAHDDVEYLLVESAGIAEPLHVAETFAMAQAMGFARLDTMVTIVDAVAVHSALDALKVLSSMEKPARESVLSMKTLARPRKLFNPQTKLLVEQICFSNVILLSKCDRLSTGSAAGICQVLGRLNTKAQVLQCENGKVDLKSVIGTGKFTMSEAENDDRWFAEAHASSQVVRCMPLAEQVNQPKRCSDPFDEAGLHGTSKRPRWDSGLCVPVERGDRISFTGVYCSGCDDPTCEGPEY